MLRLSLSKTTLLAAFCALQIADVITTKRVLDNGGWEANPLGVLAMTLFGTYLADPQARPDGRLLGLHDPMEAQSPACGADGPSRR
jgi:hypothetical protein